MSYHNLARNTRTLTSSMSENAESKGSKDVLSAQKIKLKSLQAENKSCVTCIYLSDNPFYRCTKGRKIVSIHSICHRHVETSK